MTSFEQNGYNVVSLGCLVLHTFYTVRSDARGRAKLKWNTLSDMNYGDSMHLVTRELLTQSQRGSRNHISFSL